MKAINKTQTKSKSSLMKNKPVKHAQKVREAEECQ